MGKLRLAVGPQVFVAETAHDLEVTLVTGHHQDLFENLRRLWQCIKLARIDPAGNQIVARAFRRAFGQHRRFDFDEVATVKEVAHRLGDAVAQYQIVLHFRPAQVQIAIFQPNGLIDVHIVLNIERRCLGRIEDADLFAAHFDRAGFHCRIYGFRRAQANRTAHAEDIFGPDAVRFEQRRLIDFR